VDRRIHVLSARSNAYQGPDRWSGQHPGGGLVDDRDLRPAETIRLHEPPPGDEPQADRIEEVACRIATDDGMTVTGTIGRQPDFDRCLARGLAERPHRRMTRETGGFGVRKPRCACEELA